MLVKLSYVEQVLRKRLLENDEICRGGGALWDTQYQQTELLFVYSHSLGMDDS